MKGTGFGSFDGKIVVKVAERDIAAAQDKSGVAPEWRTGDDEHGYFVLPWTVTRLGDDETVIFELSHMLGYEIKWEVLWAESEY
jgi:hypothetical protein